MTDHKPRSRGSGGSKGRRPKKSGRPPSKKAASKKSSRSSGRRGSGRKQSSPRTGKSERPRADIVEAVPDDLPQTEFEQFDLPPRLLAAVAAAGFVEPSRIQTQMIPAALDEKNVVGRSRTGTGKTAAFLLPMLALLDEVEDEAFIAKGQPSGPVRILIVVPVRELAIQVSEEAEKLTRFVPVRTVCVYGGTRIDKQVRQLKQAAVVVGTPGRLLDHIRRRTLDLSELDVIVLDEVDRMYDLGFRDDVDRILLAASNRTQTVLTSATLNEDVERLIEKHVGEHERILIESKTLTVDEVDQTFYFVDPRRKQELLLAVVEKLKPERGLVFVRTRFSVDRLTWQLQQKGLEAQMIHSGLPQRKRERILESFREGKFPLLIATDVASRGLDIQGVSHVINYDLPQNAEDYVHRVGRTARFGQRGTAVSFVTADDGPFLTSIEKLINKEIRQEVFPGFEIETPAQVEEKKKEAPARPPGLPPWANVKRRRF